MRNRGRDSLPPDLHISPWRDFVDDDMGDAAMQSNNFDVSNTVDTTDHSSVNREVDRIYRVTWALTRCH